ncbi:hypothetical protein MKX01_042702 [Papaver californicum]|nr:hypothetical protein MKX01_042702 [Papaver californicum]
MEDTQVSLGKMNNLNDKGINTSSDDMSEDKGSTGKSGNPQISDRDAQQMFTKPVSYRDAYVNSDLRWTNCFQEWGLQDSDMEIDGTNASMICEDDSVNGIPSIEVDIDTQKRIIQPWKHCLIGKVVRKTIRFKYLSFKINELWKLSGKIQILDLGYDFFLFKFDCPDDHRFALLQGPWFIGGHHLSLRR